MKIHELWTDESKWCRNANARNVHGAVVDPLDPNATQWCLKGATMKCYPAGTEYLAVINRIRESIQPSETQFNDFNTFAIVKKLVTHLDI